jgi:hypothetical protein
VSGGHTKGPWQVSGCRHSGDLKIGRDTRLHAVGPDGDAVCMVFYDMKTGRGLRDARLIAAAPELLEVARMVVEASDLAGISGPLGDAARAALAKALGQ